MYFFRRLVFFASSFFSRCKKKLNIAKLNYVKLMFDKNTMNQLNKNTTVNCVYDFFDREVVDNFQADDDYDECVLRNIEDYDYLESDCDYSLKNPQFIREKETFRNELRAFFAQFDEPAKPNLEDSMLDFLENSDNVVVAGEMLMSLLHRQVDRVFKFFSLEMFLLQTYRSEESLKTFLQLLKLLMTSDTYYVVNGRTVTVYPNRVLHDKDEKQYRFKIHLTNFKTPLDLIKSFEFSHQQCYYFRGELRGTKAALNTLKTGIIEFVGVYKKDPEPSPFGVDIIRALFAGYLIKTTSDIRDVCWDYLVRDHLTKYFDRILKWYFPTRDGLVDLYRLNNIQRLRDLDEGEVIVNQPKTVYWYALTKDGPAIADYHEDQHPNDRLYLPLSPERYLLKFGNYCYVTKLNLRFNYIRMVTPKSYKLRIHPEFKFSDRHNLSFGCLLDDFKYFYVEKYLFDEEHWWILEYFSTENYPADDRPALSDEKQKKIRDRRLSEICFDVKFVVKSEYGEHKLYLISMDIK